LVNLSYSVWFLKMQKIWYHDSQGLSRIYELSGLRVDKNHFECYNSFMKNLPIGIQTFSKLIDGDYLYVDKTKSIYDLISGGKEYYFLSRPRRFGKSVLISTLAELFRGNKELFKGLWIYDKIEWIPYPVIHIDLSSLSFESPEKLENSLIKYLNKTAQAYGVTLNPDNDHKESFVELIEKLSAKDKVVILIDEYDKPVIHFLEKRQIDKAQEIRDVLKSFYGVLKGADPFIRFVFITGVSKFSKVSIFSDLNNLADITLNTNFATLLGYTEPELQHYFSPYIERMAEKLSTPTTDLLKDIRQWYNGYSWDGEHFVYNPFSILNLFNAESFENFWFSTGTPSFLVQLIQERQDSLVDYENIRAKSHVFETYNLENLDIVALLFQTGYLTVKKITPNDDRSKTYHLSYPNREVKISFFYFLFGEFTRKDMSTSNRVLDRITAAINSENIDLFIQEIKSLFASIPYQIFIDQKEAYYHSLVYLILQLSGGSVQCEVSTNTGRIDGVLETANNTYIMEFKMGNAQEALNQIKEKSYYEKYRGNGKKIILLGVGFDPEKRNIGEFLVENL